MLRINARAVQDGVSGQRGFTIVELMIATMVFSVIILISSAVVVRFTSNFQRSLVQNTTQNSARGIIDNISQSLQVAPPGSFKLLGSPEHTSYLGYCIDGVRYSYVLGKQIGTDVSHAIVQDTGLGGACADPTTGESLAQDISSAISGKELLSPNMRLAKFTISEMPGGLLYNINVKVAYGDNDLLCSSAIEGSCNAGSGELNIGGLNAPQLAGLQCKGEKGSQYCGVSDLSTTVQRRL